VFAEGGKSLAELIVKLEKQMFALAPVRADEATSATGRRIGLQGCRFPVVMY
jgi:hypothetical protein